MSRGLGLLAACVILLASTQVGDAFSIHATAASEPRHVAAISDRRPSTSGWRVASHLCIVSACGPIGPASGSSPLHLFSMPVAFEPNRGQTDRRVRFLAHLGGATLFLTSAEAVIGLRSGSAVRLRYLG